jgi:phosphatidylserine decarboxylase
MSRLFVTLQYLLPHHLLCGLIYAVARVRATWFKNVLIKAFVRAFQPRMDDALEPDPLRYASFNAFFTRALKPDARPSDPDPRRIVSPCDGTLSIAESLHDDRMIQAKGHDFRLDALLAAGADVTASLRGGLYATIYLAPYNYHRLHMPLSGRLRSAWHVPGRIFSVNNGTVARVPALFARNERVICAFDGEHGPFVMVLVGALFVGSMATVWHGEITPWRRRAGSALAIAGVHQLEPTEDADLWQPRGAELGRFNMGSTILMLLPPRMASWDPGLLAGNPVVMGQGLGSLLSVPIRA